MGLYKMKLVGEVEVTSLQDRIIELLKAVGAGKITIGDYVTDFYGKKQYQNEKGVKVAFSVFSSKTERGIAILENGQLYYDDWGHVEDYKNLANVIEQAVYATITEKTVKAQGYLTTKIECASDFEDFNIEEGLFKLTAVA